MGILCLEFGSQKNKKKTSVNTTTFLSKILSPQPDLYNFLVFTWRGNFLLILATLCVTIFAATYKHTLYKNTDNTYTTGSFLFDITLNYPAQILLMFVLASFASKYYGYLAGSVICVNGLFYVCKTQTTNRLLQKAFTKQLKKRKQWTQTRK